MKTVKSSRWAVRGINSILEQINPHCTYTSLQLDVSTVRGCKQCNSHEMLSALTAVPYFLDHHEEKSCRNEREMISEDSTKWTAEIMQLEALRQSRNSYSNASACPGK